jgi:hypothetical protein
MAKMKLDTKRAKQYLMEKGERVALAVAAAIMVLFVGYGVVLAVTARSPHEEIEKGVAEKERELASRDPTDEEKKVFREGQTEIRDWHLGRLTGDEYYARAWFDMQESRDNRRGPPRILPIDNIVRLPGVRQIRVDAVLGGVVVYDIKFKNNEGTIQTIQGKAPAVGGVGLEGAAPTANLAKKIRPTKLIVVQATFPYLEQAELFRKAFKYEKVEELFPRDAPDFRGLNVMKRSIGPGGKPTAWKPLYEYDPNLGKVVVPNNKSIEDLFKTALYEEAHIAHYNEYMYRNAVAPLPALESGEYPPLELTGITIKGGDFKIGGPKNRRPAMVGIDDPFKDLGKQPKLLPDPGDKSGDDPDANLKFMAMPLEKVLPKAMVERILAPNFFDPYGAKSEPSDLNKKGLEGVKPGIAVQPPMREDMPGEVGLGGKRSGRVPDKLPTADKCLVRFVDVLDEKDAQPGATYQYYVQVRLANPNFGRHKEVAFSALADAKELLSPWALTPTVTMPSDFLYYAIDQLHYQPKFETKLTGTNTIDYKSYNPNEKVPIQIHRWVGTFRDEGVVRQVSDWVIAERLLLQRGEEIARREVHVETPIWVETRGQFEMGNRGGKVKAKSAAGKTGIAVDFSPSHAPDVLVDFEGGKRPYQHPRGSVNDEASQELLILNSDGKLIVRNSRDDSYDVGWKTDEDLDNRQARERRARYETWRERLRDYREPARAANPKGGGQR